MRFIGFSLAAVGLSSLLLSAVVAHAVLAPLPQNATKTKTEVVTPVWNTTLTHD